MTNFTEALNAGRESMKAASLMKGARACARAYVCFAGLDRKALNEIKTWAKKNGMIFQTQAAYGLTKALYIGYDNASGIQCGQAEAFAETVKAHGFSAYADFGQD